MTKLKLTFFLFGLCLVFTQTSMAQCDPICSLPTFQGVPPDMFILCDEPLPPLMDLMYDNGESGICANSGFITGTMIDDSNPCDGGLIVYEWNGQDVCGNLLNHIQTIMVDPPEPTMFQNPPYDMVVSCDYTVTPPTDLVFDNFAVGSCANTGTIAGVQVDNTNGCQGGTIINTWTGVDNCGEMLDHIQIITIEPVPIGMLVNLPVNMILSCGDGLPSLADLVYESGDPNCVNTGTVAGVQVDNTNGCQGGTIVNTWAGIDNCGNALNYTQTFTLEPMPVGMIVNPPINMTLSCGDILPPLTDLIYDNGSISCPDSGVLTGTQTGSTDPCEGGLLTRIWTGQDACGNTMSHTQTILFSEDICDVNNGLPTNQQIEGNLCVAGSVHASQVMRLKPLTTAPTSPLVGTMYFDDNTKKLRVWDGAAWQSCW